MTQRASDPAAPSFLSGPTIYLRGITLADAATAAAWHPSPIPRPRDAAEAWISTEIPRAAEHRHRLLACRHRDDRPLGSLAYAVDDGYTASIAIHTDPILGESGDEAAAETLRLVVPWLLHERDAMVVWIETPSGNAPLIAAAAELGMRPVCRFRESHLVGGERQDLICYEALHPAWVAKLGRPELTTEGPVVHDARPPIRSERTADLPPNVIAAGPRLLLRVLEREDADELAHGYATETESAHDTGREPVSPVAYWAANRIRADGGLPATIRLAIVTRDGVLIGTNGLVRVDWINRTAVTETEIVRQDYRGAGYGTEAKHLLLEYAFDRLGLHMVRSYAWAYNTRSCQALIKQGYRVAGGLSWTGVKNAEFVNDVVFDLLAKEWRRAAGV